MPPYNSLFRSAYQAFPSPFQASEPDPIPEYLMSIFGQGLEQQLGGQQQDAMTAALMGAGQQLGSNLRDPLAALTGAGAAFTQPILAQRRDADMQRNQAGKDRFSAEGSMIDRARATDQASISAAAENRARMREPGKLFGDALSRDATQERIQTEQQKREESAAAEARAAELQPGRVAQQDASTAYTRSLTQATDEGRGRGGADLTAAGQLAQDQRIRSRAQQLRDKFAEDFGELTPEQVRANQEAAFMKQEPAFKSTNRPMPPDSEFLAMAQLEQMLIEANRADPELASEIATMLELVRGTWDGTGQTQVAAMTVLQKLQQRMAQGVTE